MCIRDRLVSYNEPGAHGAAVVQTINDELEQHAEFGVTAGLYTEPHGFLNSTFAHFRYDFHLAESMARRLVRLETRGQYYARQSIYVVFQALRKLWRRINMTIQHFPCTEINLAPMPPDATRICHIANRCLCTEFGKEILMVHESLIAAVTHQFPRKRGGREPLRLSLIHI